MKVILAKSAGFCYGVKRAVELALETAQNSENVFMLGSIIHNANVQDLKFPVFKHHETPSKLHLNVSDPKISTNSNSSVPCFPCHSSLSRYISTMLEALPDISEYPYHVTLFSYQKLED